MAMNPRLLRPLATGFNPRKIAGLQLWFDAADASTVTLNGSAVSEWRSKVNAYAVSQGTAALQPVYEIAQKNGKNAVKFDGIKGVGVADFLAGSEVSSLFPSAATFVCAFRPNNDTGSWAGAATNPGPNPFWRFSGDGLTYESLFRSNRATGVGIGMPTDADAVYAVLSSSTNYRLFLNNVIKSTQSAAYSAGTTFRIGNSNDSVAINGWIYEIVAYNVALSTDELSRVHGYLQTKWNLFLL
jgi:hypothetical protein